MCGICGILRPDRVHEADVGAVRAMADAMVHRGPDGVGEYRSRRLMMSMRRLSIIDLEGSNQPLYNEDRRLALMANGEIYNYKELRESLVQRGHRLATEGDCEAILHLYEEYGDECVQQLRGMFAFALWDENRQRLLLARDRMGEKPLYYYESNGLFVFASELRSLMRSGLVPFELDARAVDLFFHLQYVPEPLTPIAGVSKLDAAHRMAVRADVLQLDTERYWDMEAVEPLSADPLETIRAELEALARIVVRSDVPVGVALSGGLDSSLVAAIIARVCPDTFQALSVGYPGRPRYDERADAEALARHLDMPFHDIELSVPDMVRDFRRLVWARDDPIADISGYGYYSVMRRASELGLKVMLQGQGGDELFWGYPNMLQSIERTRQKRSTRERGVGSLPGYLRPCGPGGWHPWQLREWLGSWLGLRDGWRRFRADVTSPEHRLVFCELSPNFMEALRRMSSLYTDEFRDRLGDATPFAMADHDVAPERLDLRVTALMCSTYLRENGIAQGDRLGMASSVELRLPLVDHVLVERVVGLRKHAPDQDLGDKARLRAVARSYLPPQVVDRPKQGFAPPVLEWHDAIFACYGKDLEDGYLQSSGVLTPLAARRLATGEFPRGLVCPLSFKALVLEQWCRGIVDGVE